MSNRTPALAALLLSLACGTSDPSPPPTRAAPPASAVSLVPVARDATGAPRMFLATGREGVPAGSAGARARAYLARHAGALGVSRSDLAALEVDRVISAGSAGQVTRLRPRFAGVEVVDSDLRVLTRRDGSLAMITGRPPVPPARRLAFALDHREAFARALGAELGRAVSAASLVDRGPLAGGWRAFAADRVPLLEPCRIKRVLAPAAGGLAPAYLVEILRDAGGRAVGTEYRIDAASGQVLASRRLNADAAFQYRVWADPDDLRPLDNPLVDVSPHPTGEPDLLTRDPVPSALVTMEGFNRHGDPWLPDGATRLTGNNVEAYADLQFPDGFGDGDVRTTATSPGVFDRIYRTDQEPLENARQTRAATTHLFYVNNWMHDWWYDSGFDEAAGNAQALNLDRGGQEGDRLLAEAQDAALDGVRDNANMLTPSDGVSPRMQMYLWSNVDQRRVRLSTGDTYGASLALFGPTTFDLSGRVRVASPADGCAAIGNVDGRIALIEVGGACSLESKVRRAQAGGAIGAIVTFDVAGAIPPDMPDDAGADPTIPSLLIRRADGDQLRDLLADGPVTARLVRARGVEKDSSLDTGIIAHEWGHYLHFRLQSCGSWMCYGMSEGWGDFIALHTVIRQGDDPDGTYGVGGYAAGDLVSQLGGDGNYFGIRRAPYTRDMSRNGLTYRHIMAGEPLPDHPLFILGDDNTEPHNAGEIWAVMLYEAYQNLIDRSRAGDYSFDDARRRMSDYVVAGLALAPPNATHLDTRDSILAAAAAADPEDAVAMAEGFARRGAGSCAVSPPFDSGDFLGVVEDFELSPRLAIGQVVVDDSLATCDGDGVLDGEETGRIRVTVVNPGAAPLSGAQVTLANLSAGLSLPDGASMEVPAVPAFGSVEVAFPVVMAPTSEIVDGAVDVEVTASASCEDSAAAPVRARFNLNVTPNASTLDDVEAEITAWQLGGAGDAVWGRLARPNGNHVWHGEDLDSPSDSQLVSPPFTPSDEGPLVLRFRHRYQFEFDGTYWDGGVIEYSTDAGATWQDVTELGAEPGYVGELTDISGNPLGGRMAYAAESAGWPAMETVTLDLGTSLAGQSVQVRFRLGTDAAVGAPGWDIDDVELENVTAPPFPSVDPDLECEGVAGEPDAGTGEGPDAGEGDGGDGGDDGDGDGGGADDDDDGGCGCRAGGGSPAASGILLLLALYLGAGRRRSRTKKASGRRAGPSA